MSRKRQYLIRAAAFLLIFALLLHFVTAIFQKKWVEQGSLGDTYIAEGFHDLEKNSIELAFLGNSQLIRGVSCMHLLEQYGISAYSAATGSQPTVGMYYYVKRLVKKQNLKAAVIDVSPLYEVIRKTTVRRVTDTAPFSIDKYELIFNYGKMMYHWNGAKDAVRHLWTLVFPLVQYHERWRELSRDDYLYRSNQPYVFRGNTTRLATKPLEGIPFGEEDGREEIEMKYNQERYLRRSIELLQKHGVEVLLIKTPKSDWTRTRSEQVQKLADDYGLDFIDFNEKAAFTDAGLDAETDFADSEHLNLDGAIKLTDYLAGYLQEKVTFSQAEITGKDKEDLAGYHAVLNQWDAMTPEERLAAGEKSAEEAGSEADAEETGGDEADPAGE